MSPYKPDYEFNGFIVEVKRNLSAIRSLREAILNLAYQLAEASDTQGCLLLVGSGVSNNSLIREWNRLSTVLRSSILKRLGIASYRNGAFDQILGLGLQHQLNRLNEIASQLELPAPGAIRLPDPHYPGEMLRLMIFLWIQTSESPSETIALDALPYVHDKPPERDAKGFTIKFLEAASGTSYRTVIRALETIGPTLMRHSDRSVELSAFPGPAWEKLVVLADTSRATRYFIDRSGQPRSPDSLMKRLKTLNRSDIAIGGVSGAKRICPKLDLIGSPLLDLHLHAPGSDADLSFVRKLDPALQETRSSEEKPSLAVHFLRRNRSYFKLDAEYRLWADPIECLLDLFSMRMDYQALQFQNAILPKEVPINDRRG